jgi:hypothetical protein
MRTYSYYINDILSLPYIFIFWAHPRGSIASNTAEGAGFQDWMLLRGLKYSRN